VKLLPDEAKKLGSDSNSGQFALRRTVASHRKWTLTLISVSCELHISTVKRRVCKLEVTICDLKFRNSYGGRRYAPYAFTELQEKTESVAMQQVTFNRNTKAQLRQVFDALRELMTPPEPPKRPIGFVLLEDKSKK
jgi:hypothetical protein